MFNQYNKKDKKKQTTKKKHTTVNTDGSFSMAVSNSFLSPLEKLA